MAPEPFTKELSSEMQEAREAAIRDYMGKHKGAPRKLINKARQKMKEAGVVPEEVPDKEAKPDDVSQLPKDSMEEKNVENGQPDTADAADGELKELGKQKVINF